MIKMPPSLPPAEAFTVWLIPVVEELPVAEALPVVMPAVPSEWFDAADVLFVTFPFPEFWLLFAVLRELLPVAVLFPVVATAVPLLVTFERWSTITTLP
jgi:hypothetical protein